MKRTIGLAAALLVLAGCGSSESPPPPPEVKKETVFDPLVGTIDRAKAVQQTVDEQAAAQRRQLEKEER